MNSWSHRVFAAMLAIGISPHNLLYPSDENWMHTMCMSAAH